MTKLAQNTRAITILAVGGIHRDEAANIPNPNTKPQAQRTLSAATRLKSSGTSRNTLNKPGTKHMMDANATAQIVWIMTNASRALEHMLSPRSGAAP